MNRIIKSGFLALWLLISMPVCADVIYLNNGEAYSGNIVRETEIFVRIDTLKGEDGQIKEFLHHEISYIEYGTMDIETVEVMEKEEIFVEPTREIKPEVQRIEVSDPHESIPVAVPVEPPLPVATQEKIMEEAQPQDIPAPQEAATLDNKAIAELLGEPLAQEDPLMANEIGRQFSEEQIAQLEQQAREAMNSPETKKMIFFAIAGLLGSLLIPGLICGVIGFFIAKKFDEAEESQSSVTRFDEKGKPLSADGTVVQEGMDTVPAAPSKPGGFFRRVIARLIDQYIGIGFIVLLTFLPGLFIPLDRHMGSLMMFIMFPLLLVFLWYASLSISRLSNTYGRYVMGVRVVQEDNREKPTLGQAFKRDLLLFLWPIDIFVLIFSKSKTRVGDRWAKTRCFTYTPQDPLVKRAGPGIVLAILVTVFSQAVPPYINDRTDIARDAKSYLAQRLGQDQITRPSQIQIQNVEGWITFTLKNGESYGLTMIKSDDKWVVKRVDKIPASLVGKGLSINYGY